MLQIGRRLCPLTILSNISRHFITREIPIDCSNDLNMVVLLGTVNSVNVHDSPEKSYAIMSLTTRASYKKKTGYGLAFSNHRIHIFDVNLLEKVRNLGKGDRVCIQGTLSAYPMMQPNKLWVHCVVARTVGLYLNPVDDSESADHCDPELSAFDSTEDVEVSTFVSRSSKTSSSVD
ncbi:hypothetical protein PHET_08969 [Paragonimus heterotremus]|uniref:Uncharacterized protein n=1 Tax=Paragonimus heterotremus TaxID=100268 RepID=A0A8J4T3M0_9TREM|nr:hypothetical protein PHET_08969 [Paragonimus heterotremus]